MKTLDAETAVSKSNVKIHENNGNPGSDIEKNACPTVFNR
jgi:hypothetical protein